MNSALAEPTNISPTGRTEVKYNWAVSYSLIPTGKW